MDWAEKQMGNLKESIIRECGGLTGVEYAIFTIGYQGRTWDEVRDLLIENDVTVLYDVRSVPRSRVRGFNKDEIIHATGIGHRYEGTISYIWDGCVLGGKVDNPDAYVKRGRKTILDPRAREMSEIYTQHIGWVAEKVRHGAYNVAMMCMESNPRDCHRGYTLSESLHHLHPDVDVVHIMPDGSLRLHDEYIGRRDPDYVLFERQKGQGNGR